MGKESSILEKSFSALLAFLYFIQNARTVPISSEFANPQPCLSETCIHAASTILEAMDSSVKPCDDFYAYACNGWIKDNPIPSEADRWNLFEQTQSKNYLLIKRFLDRPIDTFASKAERKAKLFYESCLDGIDDIEALGTRPMLELIEKLGGWSISTRNFSITNWNFQNTLQLIHNNYSAHPLFTYKLVINENKYALLLKRNTFLNPQNLESRVIFMTLIGELLGGDPKDTMNQMRDVLEFDLKLLHIPKDVELVANSYDAIPIHELRTETNFIDLDTLLQNGLRPAGKNLTSGSIFVDSGYFRRLSLLLSKYNETDEGRKVINNYLVWVTVSNYLQFLPKKTTDLIAKSHATPHLECVAQTDMLLNYITAKLLASHEFDVNLVNETKKMMNGIRSAFKNNAKQLEWIDTETRKAVEEKIDAVLELIGYPEFILDNERLDDYYRQLLVKKASYLENMVSMVHFKFIKLFEKFGEPINRGEWVSKRLTEVNAGYYPDSNVMMVAIGILTQPFYNPKYPVSWKFGRIGMSLGHELTHGFDNDGRLYDKDGNEKNWWTNRTIELFENKTKCFIKQYGDYQTSGMNLDGKKTLNENIADNGGLKAAYQAYLKYAEDKPEVPPLPGLNLTQKQLFFLSFAQTWCISATIKEKQYQIKFDEHAYGKYRVIGSLSNFDEFSKEFACPVGSRMNPKEKCKIW